MYATLVKFGHFEGKEIVEFSAQDYFVCCVLGQNVVCVYYTQLNFSIVRL